MMVLYMTMFACLETQIKAKVVLRLVLANSNFYFYYHL